MFSRSHKMVLDLSEFIVNGSSVCVMQWMGVIRNETLIETDITAIFVNCLRSRAN
ncbi:hypothetical protein MICCA_660012 [Microcystis aeruginosa PCC 9432]|uniref:Uncharacterized protein n=2 Tax=Microcystis aeruginosa TaxID=1126 RepID=A0A831EHS5_MICAE|nr:hypothetical protein MICCA_660012 [Microcystis aeruginosa PCC 9432]CCI24049.1 hypothetical protein MICAG_2340011 [Microcystis aeruginosa PCC 9808]